MKAYYWYHERKWSGSKWKWHWRKNRINPQNNFKYYYFVYFIEEKLPMLSHIIICTCKMPNTRVVAVVNLWLKVCITLEVLQFVFEGHLLGFMARKRKTWPLGKTYYDQRDRIVSYIQSYAFLGMLSTWIYKHEQTYIDTLKRKLEYFPHVMYHNMQMNTNYFTWFWMNEKSLNIKDLEEENMISRRLDFVCYL